MIWKRLQVAIVIMAGALASFGSALLIEHYAHLTTSSVMLAVVLALTLGRAGHHEHGRSRLYGALLLPLLAVAATEVGKRMFTDPNVGDTIFAVGMAAAIWVRRFGERAKRIGTLLVSTLTATLVTPGPVVPIGHAAPSRWWAAVIALVAFFWIQVSQWLGERVGLIDRPKQSKVVAALPPRVVREGAPWHKRMQGSTKMALQMGVALGIAFVVGRNAFGSTHWTWTVLTAFIVGSGNRGRGDVTHKAVLRVSGAAVGTVAATAISGTFQPHDDWAVVVIFVVLGVGTWLRQVSYAYWATSVTAALALLYGYFGESGNHLLVERLEGVLLGALIGVASAWLIFPIRNVDVIRRYLSIGLATLSGDLSDPASRVTLDHSLASAATAAISLNTLERFPTRWQRGLEYGRAATELAKLRPRVYELDLAAAPDRAGLSRDVIAARRALAETATDDQRAALPALAARIVAATAAGG